MMVFRVTAANCSREMTSSPNVHLEVSRALRTCFRNKRWVLSTARALGDAFIRCWLGRVRSALQCSDLTHRLPFGCSALDEKARADTKIVFARRWLPQDARARALALECFSSAVTSFYRHKERIELTGGRSVASRSKRRPAWTPRTSLHARWLLWGARLGVVEEELLPSPVPP